MNAKVEQLPVVDPKQPSRSPLELLQCPRALLTAALLAAASPDLAAQSNNPPHEAPRSPAAARYTGTQSRTNVPINQATTNPSTSSEKGAGTQPPAQVSAPKPLSFDGRELRHNVSFRLVDDGRGHKMFTESGSYWDIFRRSPIVLPDASRDGRRLPPPEKDAPKK